MRKSLSSPYARAFSIFLMFHMSMILHLATQQLMAVLCITGRAGGVYIPPFKLARMMQDVKDKSTPEYQRLTWEVRVQHTDSGFGLGSAVQESIWVSAGFRSWGGAFVFVLVGAAGREVGCADERAAGIPGRFLATYLHALACVQGACVHAITRTHRR